MDKKQAIESAKEVYENNLQQIEAAYKICEKVDPFLPIGWASSYDLRYTTLSFDGEAGGSAAEFRVVCGHIERATGEKLNRGVGGGKRYQYLYAAGWIWLDGMNNSIQIRVELNRPHGCKVTFKRSWSVTPMVDEACLGIHKPKEVKNGLTKKEGLPTR